MSTEKEIYDQMVQNGVMDPSEVPFDESENKAPNVEDGFELPYTLVLKHPIVFAKDEVKELVFRRYPRAAVCLHLPALDPNKYQMGHFVPILSDCCGVSNALVKELMYADFQKAVEVVIHFLTGKVE